MVESGEWDEVYESALEEDEKPGEVEKVAAVA